ncbi:MAG: chemotaxis protein CheX [Nitrospirae bacterium]|nr:chemotaxis protein CheX [Nitrospirota bacterium]
MRLEYIEPFVNSTIKVLDSVLQSDIVKGCPSLLRNGEIEGEVAVLIVFKGNAEGSLILNMDDDTAVKLINAMNGTDARTMTVLGIDSISEIANMIAGNAASLLNDKGGDFRVMPPKIMDKKELGRRAPGIETLQVPLFTECGEITVNVSISTN